MQQLKRRILGKSGSPLELCEDSSEITVDKVNMAEAPIDPKFLTYLRIYIMCDYSFTFSKIQQSITLIFYMINL